MVILDERADLWADRGPIKAHHKELAHLPATQVSTPCWCQYSQSGNSLNRPRGCGTPVPRGGGAKGRENQKRKGGQVLEGDE